MTTQERIIKVKKLRLKFADKCRNLTGSPVGEGKPKTANIYAGDEDRAEFLVQALGELGINAECEIYTTDGEYMVEVRL